MGGTGKLYDVKDLKDFLQGEWNLERRVWDRRAGQQGSLTGNARFAPDGDGLLYREEGRLVVGGHDGPAVQLYTYAFPAKGRAEISFRDGRPFHDLDLTAGRWAPTHLCDPDRYEGAFTVSDPDTWRVVWTVAGPRKDLVLDSTYRRRL